MKKLALILALVSFGLVEARMNKQECKAGDATCKVKDKNKHNEKKCVDRKTCKNKNHETGSFKKNKGGHKKRHKKAAATAQSRRLHLDRKAPSAKAGDKKASAQSIRMNYFGKKKTKEGEETK